MADRQKRGMALQGLYAATIRDYHAGLMDLA